MQKPEYIKIEIPISNYYARKVFCNFLKCLKNKNAVLNFSSQRMRKYFNYKILDSKIGKCYNINTLKTQPTIIIKLSKII